VLLSFGTSGDLDHALGLAAAAGLAVETVATRRLERGADVVDYSAFRLTGSAGGGPGTGR
jgi:drug/metabolite transporter (DMT)-like permease